MTARPRRPYPWQRKRRKLMLLLLVPFLFVLAFFLYRANLRSRVEERTQALRAAGMPLNHEELQAWNTLPEGAENAALIYLQAFEALVAPAEPQNLPFFGPLNFGRSEPVPPAVREAVLTTLRANREALLLLHAAPTVEQSRYPLDFQEDRFLSFAVLRQMEPAANLLKAQVLVAADLDDLRQTTQSLASLHGLARSFRNHPTLPAQMTRLGLEQDICMLVERVLNRTTLQPGQLQRLQELLAPEDERDTLRNALAGERAMTFGFIESHGFSRQMVTAAEIAGAPDRLKLSLLDFYERQMEKSTLSAVAAQSEAREHWGRGRRSRVYAASVHDSIPMYARTLAYKAAAHTALAVERFRAEHGRLPEDLDSLVPEFLEAVPPDPYAEDALQYRLLDAGYVIYSIGPDQTDNGGSVDAPPPDPNQRHLPGPLDYGLRVLR